MLKIYYLTCAFPSWDEAYSEKSHAVHATNIVQRLQVISYHLCGIGVNKIVSQKRILLKIYYLTCADPSWYVAWPKISHALHVTNTIHRLPFAGYFLSSMWNKFNKIVSQKRIYKLSEVFLKWSAVCSLGFSFS